MGIAITASNKCEADSRDKNVPWYINDAHLAELSPAVCKMFEEYSHIQPGEVRSHVLALRNRAWDIFPFPCIGQMRFLDFSFSNLPSYATILAKLKDSNSPAALLDVGCCFGQDLRRLVADGAPSKQLTGVELRDEFIELGFDLFKDRDTYEGQLIAGDIFDKAAMSALDGQADVVHAASFLHLFGWTGQVNAAIHLLRFLKNKPGVMVLGRQAGSDAPGEYPHKTNESGFTFSHNEQTFFQMWKEVEAMTSTKWTVKVSLQDPNSQAIDQKLVQWKENKLMWLSFEALRVQ